MRRKMNKGVSMVEILISIAIFALLMTPIVSGIISSLNNSTEAKTLQYRNEFAENMMEYVKQDSLANIMSGEYFSTVGSYTDGGTTIDAAATFYVDPNKAYDSSLDEITTALADQGITPATPNSTVNVNLGGGNHTYYPFETYAISGKVKLGTKHETYSYAMEISNKYYAEKESEGGYINPNNLALGIVEDIDHTKVALINGTIANYDEAVSKAFLTKKIERLKESDPDWYEIYTQQQTAVDLFTSDIATRIITVKVSGSETDGYKVTCNLKYHDSNDLVKDYDIEYNPFEFEYPVDEETGRATLPNIYLMYNVCLYNGQYSPHDYIAIDTADMDDDTKINLFIVETAETYSATLANANKDLVTTDEDGNIIDRPTLYNENYTSDATKRNDVIVHLAATKDSKVSNLSVYHNFDINATDEVYKEIINKKNRQILFNSNDYLFSTYFTMSDYKPLIRYESGNSIDKDNSVADFTSLDGAQEESRGLYEVKIWIEKGDTVDTTVNPTITGTKGGDES